jgi:glyoxylase-like metal-dependent hydrolase (beta-lactamase superfamily II)
VEIQRILAPNPGLFTGPGTNTYLLGSSSDAVIIDPGPIDQQHREAILAVVTGYNVSGILVTHSHPDHAPLANPLGIELDVPVFGYEPGPDFAPDQLLGEGDSVDVGDKELRVLYTPGHSSDHLCFLAGDVLFTGDHIMEGSTVVVEDMVAYLASLRRLGEISLRRLYPGHGSMMDDPQGVIDEYISHRLEREEQVVRAHPLAAHSVAAHLNKLVSEGRVRFDDGDDLWRAFVGLLGATHA